MTSIPLEILNICLKYCECRTFANFCTTSKYFINNFYKLLLYETLINQYKKDTDLYSNICRIPNLPVDFIRQYKKKSTGIVFLKNIP